MVSHQQKLESSTSSSCHSRSDPSSHTGYAYLRTPEKDERLRRLHQDKRKLNLRITCLEKKLSLATAQNGVNLTEDLHDDFKEIASDNISKCHPEDSLARLFWDQHVKASQFKKSTSMKWHPYSSSGAYIYATFLENPMNYCGTRVASSCRHSQP